MSSQKKEFFFKLTVIGDGMVGKTTLIKKFTQGIFQTNYIRTIGAQFTKFVREINEDTINLVFWDIAGQDDFFFLRPSFYKESRAAIIVYSLEENQLGEDSYNHVTNWYKDIKKYCGKIPFILFGNKVDLRDKDILGEPKLFKLSRKSEFIGHYFTSALTGEGVIDAFDMIIKELYERYKKISDNFQNNS